MSLSSNIGSIVHASDLVTVQHGTKYYKVYYFFTNADLNRIDTIRNNVGFNFYAPPSTDVPHLLYWQIDKEKISADQKCENGLSTNISAFLHNIDMFNIEITPNLPSTLTSDTELSVLSSNGKLTGKTQYDLNDTKTLDLSTFRCTWLSDYIVQYSNTYPSVALTLSAQHDGYRFDHWKISSDSNQYVFENDEFIVNEIIEVNSNLKIYPDYVKQVYLSGYIENGLGIISGLRDSFDKNELICLSIFPYDHYHFVSCDGSIIDKDNTDLSIVYAVLSSLNNTISAYFDKNRYTLQAQVAGNDGEIVSDKINTNCQIELTLPPLTQTIVNNYVSGEYEYGTEVQLKAVNDTIGKYCFINWSDGVLTKSRKITLDKSYDLSAVFAKSGVLKLSITVCPEGAGFVRQTNDNGLYYYGNSTILHAFETNSDYKFDHWSTGSTDATYIMHNLQTTTGLSAIYVNRMRLKSDDDDDNFIVAYVDGVLEDIVYQK